MVIKVVAMTTMLVTGLMQPSSVYYVKNETPIIEVRETFVAEVSAYTNAVDETDSDNNITASGKIAEGNIVACPIRFKFGTTVEINGKIFVCEDRMNSRYRHGDYFDILVETKTEAFEWGRRNVEVKVLNI